MDDVEVPSNPNPFITQWLLGSICKAMVREKCEKAAAAYVVEVTKRTGELAASTQVTVEREGDRYIGLMTIGDEDTLYGAAHEFGTEDFPGAHDLNTVLDLLATL
jgi:hypothetical protein